MALGKATPCRRSLEFNKENTASAALTSRRSLQPATMPISEVRVPASHTLTILCSDTVSLFFSLMFQIDKALGLHFSNNKSPLKEANLVSRHGEFLDGNQVYGHYPKVHLSNNFVFLLFLLDFPDYTSESPKALEVLRAVDPVTLELNMNFPWTNSPIRKFY